MSEKEINDFTKELIEIVYGDSVVGVNDLAFLIRGIVDTVRIYDKALLHTKQTNQLLARANTLDHWWNKYIEYSNTGNETES